MKLDVEHKRRVQKHFDDWAKSYDSGQLTRWTRAFQQRIIKVIAPAPDDRVLDVGCGTGWAVRRLGQMLPNGLASGVDLSDQMIEQARASAEGIDNVEFKVGDSENIPYGDEQFDAVMCSASFHHYPNPVKALAEFRRVLKPGGRAYVLDTCRDGSLLVHLYDWGQKVVGDHVRYYHSREIASFFAQAGFQNVREAFRVQRLFLHGKFLTSLVLISARK